MDLFNNIVISDYSKLKKLKDIVHFSTLEKTIPIIASINEKLLRKQQITNIEMIKCITLIYTILSQVDTNEIIKYYENKYETNYSNTGLTRGGNTCWLVSLTQSLMPYLFPEVLNNLKNTTLEEYITIDESLSEQIKFEYYKSVLEQLILYYYFYYSICIFMGKYTYNTMQSCLSLFKYQYKPGNIIQNQQDPYEFIIYQFFNPIEKKYENNKFGIHIDYMCRDKTVEKKELKKEIIQFILNNADLPDYNYFYGNTGSYKKKFYYDGLDLNQDLDLFLNPSFNNNTKKLYDMYIRYRNYSQDNQNIKTGINFCYYLYPGFFTQSYGMNDDELSIFDKHINNPKYVINVNKYIHFYIIKYVGSAYVPGTIMDFSRNSPIFNMFDEYIDHNNYQNKDSEKVKLKILSGVFKSGGSSGGHYTAFKRVNNTYYFIDDNSVIRYNTFNDIKKAHSNRVVYDLWYEVE
jgi:ubiquitin C-terminal hydrolase